MRGPTHTLLGAACLAAVVLLACGRREEPHGGAGGGLVTGALRSTGRLTLTGSLAAAREGGVLLRLVEQTTGRVLLQRIYDLGDPLWDRRDGVQGLYYALTPAFELDAAPPVHAPLVLEAIHLPPGVAAEPAASNERVAATFSTGGRDLDLVLHAAASVAGGPAAESAPR